MTRRTQLSLALLCSLVAHLSPPLVSAAIGDKGKGDAPPWGYALHLKCRDSGQTTFDNGRTFGLEVYGENKGKALYITETGSVAVGDFGEFDRNKPRPPTWLHKLDLKVRPPGFEPPPIKFGLEVYRDENNGHWMYIAQTGACGVAPGAGPFKAAKTPKAAAWLHGFDLKVRKAGEKGFDKNTKVWGVEVFRDENNGNLVYMSQGGALTVASAAKDSPASTPAAKAPMWLYAFNLKVRKAARPAGQFATFGLEVYRDENNGNLIYVSETGSLAVGPGKQKLPAPLGKPQPPTLMQEFDLKCRKASENDFGSHSFGIATFADPNSDCTVYISESGAIAAVSKR